jgi:prepilin-type N-terminal cleavage/methylation domain-containing protein
MKGFTLIELLIVIVILAVLTVIVLAAINPVEQLKKAKDTARKIDANEMVRAIERYQAREGKNPDLDPMIASITCTEIVVEEPVVELGELQSELSSWFSGRINEPDKRLYVGLLPHSGLIKICYRVESMANITKSLEKGCFVNSLFYLCVPE